MSSDMNPSIHLTTEEQAECWVVCRVVSTERPTPNAPTLQSLAVVGKAVIVNLV